LSGRPNHIADTQNNRVRVASDEIITTIARNRSPGFSGDSGAAAAAQLSFPSGVAVDSAGNVYLVDTNKNRIRKVSNGVITTVAGTGTSRLWWQQRPGCECRNE
jgi:DNA-binding beta-propeller fold protein YncE